MTGRRPGAVFVLPVEVAGKTGPVAAWLTTSGWAAAAERRWGDAWVATPGGVFTPQEARRLAARPGMAPASRSAWWRRIPTILVTAAKDVRQWRAARGFEVRLDDGPWKSRDVIMVWQRHELFAQAGAELARRSHAPLVIFAAAPQVWEARTWGVRRPGWGRLLERRGEAPQLRSADLVVCPSELVATELRRASGRTGPVLVVPGGVDTTQFRPDVDGRPVRGELGLDGRMVIGWAGSFRPFHGLDVAVDAMELVRRHVPDAVLLLVGDGPQRARIEQRAASLGVETRCTGTVGHEDMPALIAAMDVALVLHAGTQTFHYGPIKLAEYLASGRAVVAPRAGELEPLGEHAGVVLVDGGPQALADAIVALADDPQRRARLGAAGRVRAEQEYSWDRVLDRAVDVLQASGFTLPGR